MWDVGTRVYVRLEPTFKNKVCGLCGNFDGNGLDDFRTRQGELTGFDRVSLVLIQPRVQARSNHFHIFSETLGKPSVHVRTLTKSLFILAHMIRKERIGQGPPVGLYKNSHFRSATILLTRNRFIDPVCGILADATEVAIVSVSAQRLLLIHASATNMGFMCDGDQLALAVKFWFSSFLMK